MTRHPHDKTATPADDGARHVWRRAAVPLAVAVVVLMALVLRAWVIGVYAIPSESMEPTLDPGDRVLVAKWRGGEAARGEVVVFDGRSTWGPVIGSPAGLLERLVGVVDGHEARFVYVKRVIGLGGDRVACCDRGGRLLVNGRAWDEPYLADGDMPSDQRFEVVVPPGRVWLMGDHRSHSGDSRAHLGSPGGGTVAAEDIIGPVLFRYWPPSRMGTVSTSGGDGR